MAEWFLQAAARMISGEFSVTAILTTATQAVHAAVFGQLDFA
jgi:hypothetical protein